MQHRSHSVSSYHISHATFQEMPLLDADFDAEIIGNEAEMLCESADQVHITIGENDEF